VRLGRRCVVMRSTPNKRMNTDPQQQCCAPLLWAGYAQRYAASGRCVVFVQRRLVSAKRRRSHHPLNCQ